MSDRLSALRSQMDAYRNDGRMAVVCDHFNGDDIAWLLAEVERLRSPLLVVDTASGDVSVVQDVTKLECPDGARDD